MQTRLSLRTAAVFVAGGAALLCAVVLLAQVEPAGTGVTRQPRVLPPRDPLAPAAPGATEQQLTALREKTEQYCVVMQTLRRPPALQTAWDHNV